ncbi:hypothetical protein JK635_02330 [Neobacillus sp. YIM B02564]|uniref:Uncharacterized protein n=1 Tax=Neobacillus paridis TaxID=2803862 RepID=A0ABS1TII4_9BACI|nr:hypothetical protein [Neobacillus paridis]MBL4951077.1 hypothetical protein [Neobacillus paridis]
MIFIQDSLPSTVTVVPLNDDPMLQIKSIQYLDETEDRVILKCAEYVEELKRGFTCNLIYEFNIGDRNRENKEKRFEEIKDLVLVYINRTWDVGGIPTWEYVFFK